MEKRKKEEISEIIIHHSGSFFYTFPYTFIKHKYVNKWEDIGYHFMIGNGFLSKNGKTYYGRRIEYQGAHVKNHNKKSIGVCVFGNYDKRKVPKKQKKALFNLVTKLAKEYNIKAENIKGHTEYPEVKKSCPGKMISMNEIRREIKKKSLTKLLFLVFCS